MPYAYIFSGASHIYKYIFSCTCHIYIYKCVCVHVCVCMRDIHPECAEREVVNK